MDGVVSWFLGLPAPVQAFLVSMVVGVVVGLLRRAIWTAVKVALVIGVLVFVASMFL